MITDPRTWFLIELCILCSWWIYLKDLPIDEMQIQILKFEKLKRKKFAGRMNKKFLLPSVQEEPGICSWSAV